MATFSPSPAPRRGRLGHGTPPGVGGRLRNPSARATSRLATPAFAAQNHDSSSLGSGMDIDEEGNSILSDRSGRAETLLAKSEEMSVALHAILPTEVKQTLKKADFFTQSFTGEVDTATGFSLIASSTTCFVWQHAQAVRTTPTCYIFSCGHWMLPAPFHKLVPHGTSREPGLILISIHGEIRFWDGIGIGLAGGEQFFSIRLDLSPREIITNLLRADTYITSTSHGRLFRLTVTSLGGRNHLTAQLFSRPQGGLSLSNLIPNLWSSPTGLVPIRGNASAVTLGARTPTTTDVWVLVETRVQKWTMSSEGWEEAVLDQDIGGLIRPAIHAAFPSAPSDDSSLDLELLDFEFEKRSLTSNSGKMVILVSYAGKEETMAVDMVLPRRVYALVRMSYASGMFRVEYLSTIPYQNISISGAPMHPRLQLIHQGALVVIQFGDAVAFCARDSRYRHRLELKSATDRTLGVGIVGSESSVLILTAATMMRASLDMDQIRQFSPETGQANLIKSIMMQAIVYGSNYENPLHFSFPPEVDEESLMQAAEQLSAAVLESDHEVVKRNHDLGWQMAGRKERLGWLIAFINENGVQAKLSQSCRQQLAVDAEKLSACHRLWQRHNELLQGGHVHSVLDEAVYNLMIAAGEGHHEDVLRAFFRLKIADIGNLLVGIVALAKKASQDTRHSMERILPEANQAIYTVLSSAFEYREFNKDVYGIEFPMIDPWTSTPTIISSVHDLFRATALFVDTAADSTSDVGTSMPNSQLPELAKILFQCFKERLDWLGSATAAEEPGAERDRQELEERFALLRPDVLDTLRVHGHSGYAFTLAEQYRDFRTLAILCHVGKAYPPDENPNMLRIQEYIERFKDEFTTELYQWYIEHGEVRALFAQEDQYGSYMDRFFDKHPHPSISWIHNLGKRRHGSAAVSLLAGARNVSDLATRHLMLSIGKLSHLAQMHENEGALDQSVLDSFHDELDYISVHDSILVDMKSALAGVRTKQALDAQIETISKKKASKLQEMTALLEVFKGLVRQLLQGKALSLEDAVDILTLKDNKASVRDYATALHLLARDKQLPTARRLWAFRAVWRRIYLHDDWDMIRQTRNVTDAALNERFEKTALYVALRDVLHSHHKPEGFHLEIADAVPIPTSAEIASRWPGMAPEEVEALAIDYQLESKRVVELALDDVYDRVKELAELRADGDDDVFR